MGRVGAIIQARVSSERLPGKMLEKVGGKFIVEFVRDILYSLNAVEKVVLATGDIPENAPLLELCASLGIEIYTGPEDDVLTRIIGCAEVYGFDTIVRATGDNPLVDLGIVGKILTTHLEMGNDYTYEDSLPYGTSAEVVVLAALKRVRESIAADDAFSREHVTAFIRRNQDGFKVRYVPFLEERPGWRVSIDTPEDLELVRRVVEELGGDPSFDEIDRLFRKRPELMKINAGVDQKKP